MTLEGERMMLRIFGVLVLAGCAPPCRSWSSPPSNVCYRADAGSPREGAPFRLRASTFFGNDQVTTTACAVGVEGAVISLTLSGTVCPGDTFSQMAPYAAEAALDCEVPALDAGTYSVAGVERSRLTIATPSSGTTEMPPCL